MELIGIFGSRVPTEPQILLNYLNTITIFGSWHFGPFFFFSFPALTTTYIFLPLMASKFQDLFFWFVLCSKYSQPLQLCAGRGGAAVPAQNCVLYWLPVQKKELFSHLPALPCGMKPSDTWCSYLCSAGERQEDVAEGPRGFPCHFCLSGPAGGSRWGDLCPAGCCWLWSPERWLLAVRVSHWHCCSCGWYLSRRDTKVGGVGHRRCFMPWEKSKKSYKSRLGMNSSHEI